jgi:two-component system cell cycle sensor histidine kinase/response regulator CckA
MAFVVLSRLSPEKAEVSRVSDAAATFRLLLIEDDPTQAHFVTELLASGYSGLFEVTTKTSLATALPIIRSGEVDVVLLDLNLPDSEGLATCARVHLENADLPIVILTVLSDEVTALKALGHGAQDYLIKGQVDGTLIRRSVQYAIERKAAEREREHLLVSERHARASAEASEARSRFLAEASTILSSSLELEETLRSVARLSTRALADWCLVRLVNSQGKLVPVEAAHRLVSKEPALRQLLGLEGAAQVLLEAVRTGRSALFPHAEQAASWNDPAAAQNVQLLKAVGTRSIMVVPIAGRGRSTAVLTFGRSETLKRFDEADLALAEELARRGGVAIDNARLFREAREAENYYRLLFDENPQPLWLFDEVSYAVLAANDAALEHYGFTRNELIGSDVRKLFADTESSRRFEGSLRAADGERYMVRSRHRKRDGSVIEVEVTSNHIEIDNRSARLDLITDISDRVRQEEALQRSEEQLRQSQKMEAVGRLAGGIAHDFNNLLTAISGHAQLLYDELPEHLRLEVREIATAAGRAAALTHQLLAFSRRQVLQPVILDLNDAVQETESLLRRVIGEDIQVTLELDPELGRVKADPAQMQQVLMNLVLNARDSMPNGGTLRISTRNVTNAGASSIEESEMPEGNYALVTLADSGDGMSAETLSHIFEPFFTTKEAGKGTGLGLATVYGILRQSEGFIFAESEQAVGTTFRVLLPVCEGQPDAARKQPGNTTAGAGGETILVVEDEESVRALVRKVLEKRGYIVLTAKDGMDALEIIAQRTAPIDLMLTDVVMPGIAGQDLAQQVSALRPEIRVVFMSGYADDAIAGHGLLNNYAHFLEKPFTPKSLENIVRSVLDGV